MDESPVVEETDWSRRQEEEGAVYPSSPIPLKPWELTYLEKFNDKGPLFQTLIRSLHLHHRIVHRHCLSM